MRHSFSGRRGFLGGLVGCGAGLCLGSDAWGRQPPAPAGKHRVAAVTTCYHRYSHADNIITRFIEGYSITGRSYPPPCRVASLFIHQTPDNDIGRPLARHWDVPTFNTITEALTLGGKTLAVDGVLLIAEQGDYPINKLGQRLYPRHEFFAEIVRTFQASKRAVPVFVDKHLSYSWDNAAWMYEQSRKLAFAMMAGSSVPVAYRRPDLRPEVGVQWSGAVSVGHGHFEAYGFHALEALQVMMERRRGGETGVRAVQCLEGKAIWEAARAKQWDRALLDAALERVPSRGKGKIEEDDRASHLFLIEYRDGLRAATYMSSGHAREFAFAGRAARRDEPLACYFELPRPQRDHFSFLVQNVARMFETGKPTYPVERTLLTTGMLAALMVSKAENHRRVETPHLDIRYQI